MGTALARYRVSGLSFFFFAPSGRLFFAFAGLFLGLYAQNAGEGLVRPLQNLLQAAPGPLAGLGQAKEHQIPVHGQLLAAVQENVLFPGRHPAQTARPWRWP